jgi:hypothetical protein
MENATFIHGGEFFSLGLPYFHNSLEYLFKTQMSDAQATPSD